MKQDRVLTEQVWVAADSAGWKGGLVDCDLRKRGRNSVRWDTTHSGQITNTSVAGDWSTHNRLDFWLHSEEPTGDWVMVEIWCASRTGDLPMNDYYFSGVKVDWSGWKHLVLPFQNFLIYGIPRGWSQIEKLTFTRRPASAPDNVFHIDEVHIANVDFPEGPRLTDEEFFTQELDLAHAGMESVKSAVADEDWHEAAKRLFTHLRTRTAPVHIFARDEVDPSHDTSAADQICAHFINGQQLGQEIDWQANPIGYLEWMHAFNRHTHWNTLALAYRATGDEKYAREWNAQLASWIRNSPVPIDNDGGWGAQWKMICVGCRTMNPWFESFYSFLHSPSFKTGTLVMFLKSLVEHARQVEVYNDITTTANMRVMQGRGLVNIAVCFPELAQSGKWRALAFGRLTQEITERQVYPDGAQKEHSPGYHDTCARLFSGAYELAKVNSLDIPEAFGRQLEMMYEYELFVARPDGTRPSLNDAGGVSADERPFLNEGARLFDRDDLRFVGTGGKAGSPPTQMSRRFPWVGHATMRSGWDAHARYLLFDHGAVGETHQHEDKLNVEVHAYGTTFIVDPGIASYMLDAWTAYYRGSESHNVVLVDGKHQNRRSLHPSEYIAKEPIDDGWLTTDVMDYVKGVYDDGYGTPPDRSVTHTRQIVYVRDPSNEGKDYWVIVDELTGRGEEGRGTAENENDTDSRDRQADAGESQQVGKAEHRASGSHSYQTLWHFMPMRVVVDPETKAVRTRRLGRPNLDIIPLERRKHRVEIVTGRNEPVQGWIADGGRARDNVPSPCVVYHSRGKLPVRFGWVLLPYLSGDAPAMRVEKLSARGRGLTPKEITALRVTHDDGQVDEIAVSNGGGVVRFGACETDGVAAVVVLAPDGSVKRSGVAGGGYVKPVGRKRER